MKGYCPLASGSKGNCLLFASSQTKILIDAGISARMTEQRLATLGITLGEIDAILLTHEHGDHIAGLKVLALKYGIPLLANHETAKGVVDALHDCPKFKIFTTGETFEFRDLEIHPFSIQHDTPDPVAFTIRSEGYKYGFCTDIGFATSQVESCLRDCDFLVLEANHQISMVHSSHRPYVYKQRVLSRSGHLSNEEAGTLLSKIAHPGLKQVHLAHLSSECNHPDTALGVIQDILDRYGIDLNLAIAFQDRVSDPAWASTA